MYNVWMNVISLIACIDESNVESIIFGWLVVGPRSFHFVCQGFISLRISMDMVMNLNKNNGQPIVTSYDFSKNILYFLIYNG
jgi:hypothetical protein